LMVVPTELGRPAIPFGFGSASLVVPRIPGTSVCASGRALIASVLSVALLEFSAAAVRFTCGGRTWNSRGGNKWGNASANSWSTRRSPDTSLCRPGCRLLRETRHGIDIDSRWWRRKETKHVLQRERRWRDEPRLLVQHPTNLFRDRGRTWTSRQPGRRSHRLCVVHNC
jgi:hypothetical protein